MVSLSLISSTGAWGADQTPATATPPAATPPAATPPAATPPAATAPGGTGVTPPVPITLPPPPAPVVPPIQPTLPPGVKPAVPINRPISLDEAVAVALANQPTVGIAIQDARSAHGRTLQSRSALYPQIGFGSSYSRSGSSTSGRVSSATELPVTTGGLPAGTTGSTATTGGTTAGTTATTGSVATTGGTTGATTGGVPAATTGTTGTVPTTGGTTGTVVTTGGTTGSVAFSSSSSSDSFDNSLSVRQLLFDFGRTRDSVRAALAAERAAQYGVNRAREDTIFNVKQAYYNLLNSQRLVTVAEQTVNDSNAHVSEAAARQKAGLAPPSDVVKANAALAQAQLTLTSAQNNVELDRIALNETMGIDVRTPIQIAEPAPANLAGLDLNPMISEAFTRRPEVLQAQQQLISARASLASAKTGNLPDLSASASGGVHGHSLFGNTHTWSIGVSLSWDPFDFGLTSGRIIEARSSLRSQELTLYQAQQTVSTEVSQAFLNLRTSQQQLATATAEVDNAQVEARLAEGRYQAGVAIFLEVTDAEAALATAQADQVNARTSIDIARAALDRAVGRAQ